MVSVMDIQQDMRRGYVANTRGDFNNKREERTTRICQRSGI